MTSRPNPNSSAPYFDALAYSALLATIATAAAGYFPPLAQYIGLLFPTLALSTALLLLWRKPVVYICFMWWAWFLTPEIRRIVDYRTGYHEQSLVMLAPFLVSGVALIAVLANLQRLALPYRLPFAFVAFGLLYAYIIGFLNNGLISSSFDLLSWGTPVIGGAYLLTHPQYARAFRRASYRTFMWGLLVMGLYSILQYFYLPPWDAYWMRNADLVSIGAPEPRQVRVFSTLNSPGPFAQVMMAGLLLAFGHSNLVQVLGSAAGFIGFALSAVRAAWGGWVIGFLVVLSRLSLRVQLRLIGTLTLLAIVAIPLFTVGPVAELLSQRLASVTNLENDTSFNERLDLYAGFSSFTAKNPLGQGLGSTGVASSISNAQATLQNLDSGIIAVLYTFGILGTIYFVGGTLTLFGKAIIVGSKSGDVYSATYAGITAGSLAQLFFGNAWGGVTGMVLWFFPCLLLALQDAESETKPSLPTQTYEAIKRVRVYRI